MAKVAIRQKSIDKLLGVEGLAAKTYFETFSLLIKGDDFVWNGRKRRPASDFEMNGDRCFLKEEARNRFIKAFEEYMGEYIDDSEETWRGKIAKELAALKMLLKNYAKNKE